MQSFWNDYGGRLETLAAIADQAFSRCGLRGFRAGPRHVRIRLAGGFIGWLAKTNDITFNNMKTAIIVGSAMASYCVEKFGPDRLKEITKEDIDKRIKEFVDLVSFDIELG